MTRHPVAVSKALEQFQAVEVMGHAQGAAHDDVSPAYTDSLRRSNQNLLDACQHPKVIAAMAAAAFRLDTRISRPDPLARLAAHFVSRPSFARGTYADTSPEQWQARIAGGLLLSQSLGTLACGLEAATLLSGNHRAVIDTVRQQDITHNAKFQKRPVFGPERADAYISAFRGHRLLFLRAEAAEAIACVCLMAASIDGESVDLPSKVAAGMELPGESIADVLLDGDQIILSDIRPRT